jgi:DNA modification methylase
MGSEVALRATGLPLELENPLASIVPGVRPSYFTEFGAAYAGDSLDLLARVRSESVSLVVTSPPYPLVFKKEYGNVDANEYVAWILSFIPEIRRVLREDGSFVLNVGGVWTKGAPVRSLVHYELALAIAKELPLAQELFWYNPAKLPAPAEWVNVRRIRVKDSVEFIWWFGKTPNPKADNRGVLQSYSPDMHRLIRKGVRATVRPSGHNITKKFAVDKGGSIPSNLIQAGNTDATSDYYRRCAEAGVKPHPARFPPALPEFFIKLTTDPGQIVLDPFAGSNTTGWVAQGLRRRWVAFDLSPEYVESSSLRFPETAVYGKDDLPASGPRQRSPSAPSALR